MKQNFVSKFVIRLDKFKFSSDILHSVYSIGGYKKPSERRRKEKTKTFEWRKNTDWMNDTFLNGWRDNMAMIPTLIQTH